MGMAIGGRGAIRKRSLNVGARCGAAFGNPGLVQLPVAGHCDIVDMKASQIGNLIVAA
jgi:hypothetical protein